ncbi:hypothetical protein [Acinetobacter seifertii]|uniref:Uncharacterized protein n=1 Tax=Acinetobacter seifertii TaxID=1530123 RepID=A0A7H2V917_9GAMM|nr:hypothetical protein [Acinetobacter seifertii]QNX72850.1 hypothetical protein IC776_02815 [Acinetobacter seifertii]
MNNKLTKKQKKFNEEINEETFSVERIVPVTKTEILGVSLQSDDGIVLEFGFIKDDKEEVAIVDTRKYLPKKMVDDLYKKLKYIYENEEIK